MIKKDNALEQSSSSSLLVLHTSELAQKRINKFRYDLYLYVWNMSIYHQSFFNIIQKTFLCTGSLNWQQKTIQIVCELYTYSTVIMQQTEAPDDLSISYRSKWYHFYAIGLSCTFTTFIWYTRGYRIKVHKLRIIYQYLWHWIFLHLNEKEIKRPIAS